MARPGPAAPPAPGLWTASHLFASHMTRPMPTTSKSKKINSQSIIEFPSAHSDRDQYSSSHCIHIDTDQNGQSDGASQAVIREHRGSRRAAEFSCRMRVPDGTKQVFSFCRELFQKILCPSFEGVGGHA
jgi:hypothetical protein